MHYTITNSACVHFVCTFLYRKGKKDILCHMYYGVTYCFSYISKTKIDRT